MYAEPKIFTNPKFYSFSNRLPIHLRWWHDPRSITHEFYLLRGAIWVLREKPRYEKIDVQCAGYLQSWVFPEGKIGFLGVLREADQGCEGGQAEPYLLTAKRAYWEVQTWGLLRRDPKWQRIFAKSWVSWGQNLGDVWKYQLFSMCSWKSLQK